MPKFIVAILEYATHASTWKGIIAVVTAAGVTLSPEQSNAIIALGLSLVGLIQVFVDDHDKDNLA